MIRRIGLLAIVSVLLTGLCLWGCDGESESVVSFPDLNLETAIREALNKPSGDIYASELVWVTTLTADNMSIKDLSGLQYCANLTDLRLPSNNISDISPLDNLTNLTTLVLRSNQISNISPLSDLTRLRRLALEFNQISDISPLANLTNNLTTLVLTSNQISNISPLFDLTRLRTLALGFNQISDISPLANLTNLESLILRDNQISDIAALVGNEGLGTGDTVQLINNPLSPDSINIYVPQLEARNVTVSY